jgi:hypothetical protein
LGATGVLPPQASKELYLGPFSQVSFARRVGADLSWERADAREPTFIGHVAAPGTPIIARQKADCQRLPLLLFLASFWCPFLFPLDQIGSLFDIQDRLD